MDLIRSAFTTRLNLAFSQANGLAGLLPLTDSLPPELAKWLDRLHHLVGVPFNYLVPDEAMLPPESIRFFYLDPNWMAALADGATSIGRNLTTGTSRTLAIDQANVPRLDLSRRTLAGTRRASDLGLPAPDTTLTVVSGFLLRSALVPSYPGLGVYAYAKDQAPGETNTPQTLTILRLERLGPESDTLLCLVDGDVHRFDLHEAPEQLHYGLDRYDAAGGTVQASKNLHPFTIVDGKVVIRPDVVPVEVGSCFRAAAPRTLNVAALSAALAQANATANGSTASPAPPLDSAQLGFEMTQGVGLVSFINHTPEV